MIQFIIAVTGLTALALTQQKKRPDLVKFAPILGLIGQPFWLYSTYTNLSLQWGIFTLCCCYTVVWAFGLYNSWFANDYQGFKEFKAELENRK